MTNSVDRLAARIMRLERQLHAATTTPQLEFSSIMDGAIAAYDVDDNLTQVIGKQYDETWAINTVTGPTPPTPTAPIVTPGSGSITVAWDGFFADDPTTVAPMDFARVEVHLTSDPNADFRASDSLRDSIETPRGGEIVVSPIPSGTPYYAALVTRTTSGASSAVSVVVSGEADAIVSDADMQAMQTEVDAANAAATDAQNQASSAASDAATALNTANTAQQAANTAQSAADAAQAAATQAQSDADAANQQALDAANLADTKGTVYFQPTAPAGDPNGLWIDSDNGNLANTWDGTQWVPTQDADIQAAANAAAAADTKAQDAQTAADSAASTANAAQTTANQASTDAQNALTQASQASSDASNALTVAGSKSTVYYTTAAPTGGTYRVDDLWFDTTSSAYTPHRWDGSQWVAVPFGTNALADGIITAAKIVTGTITGDKIKAGEINSNLLAAGAVIAGKIAADAVDANAIAANAVTAAKIAAGQIQAGHMAAGSVTTAALDALAVTADKIAANAVTADQIAAGAITSEKIDAEAVWAGKVTADHIDDGSLNAQVAVVGSLTAYGANGEMVQLSGDGFVVKGAPAADGSVPTFVNFPTQGDKPDIFTGVLDATTLTVEQGATMGGVIQIAPKAQLLLGNQVMPPKNAPTVSSGWDSVNQDQYENSRTWHGLTVNPSDGRWWSSWYRASDDTSGLTEWLADGSIAQDFVTGSSRGRARDIVFYQSTNGPRFLVLRNAQGEAGWVDRLEVWDTGFNTMYGQFDFRINYGSFWGALGWDHVNNRLIYTYFNQQGTVTNGLPSAAIVFEHWSLDANGVPVSKMKTRKTIASNDFCEAIAHVEFGTFDFGDGVNRYVTHLRNEHSWASGLPIGKFLVFPDTEGANYDDGWSWNNAGGYDVCGIYWDGSNFHSMGARATRWKYEGGMSYYHNSATFTDWIWGYTWRDGVSPYHETTLSPTARTNPDKRSKVTVTFGATPTGDADYPDRVRIYMAQVAHNATLYTVADFDLWAEVMAGATSWVMDPNAAPIDSTTGAPASNTFPSTTSPGYISSPNGQVTLKGDGSGQIGGLTWDGTGNIKSDFNKPYVSEYRINNMSVGSGGSAVVVNFGTTEAWVNLPAGGIVGNGDGTYTVNMAGKYIVNAQLSWDSNSSGRREASIWLNGVSQMAFTASGDGSMNQTTSATKVFQLKVGDVISIRAWQNSGAALNIIGGQQRTAIQIAMIAGGS